MYPQECVPYILGYATLRNINIDILFSDGEIDSSKCLRVTPYPWTKTKFKAEYSLKLTWDPKDRFCVVQKSKKDKNQAVRFQSSVFMLLLH